MSLWDPILSILTGTSPFNYEIRAFCMAYQGAMVVRNGANKNKDMHFFHALALTSICAFGGGWLAFIWLGKPTSMISAGDVNIPLCVAAFVLATYTPGDIGYKLGNFLPAKVLTTAGAQLFRSLGMIGFISVAFKEVSASPYYPIPVLGPVMYGALLGNMGGFLRNGFDGYLKNGVPFPFQNGIVVGLLFHLFVHDETGPLGTNLRSFVHSIGNGALLMGLDDRTFAVASTSAFMLVSGVLMLPEFKGPKFNPFVTPAVWAKDVVVGSSESELTIPDDEDLSEPLPPREIKKRISRRNKNKKKKA